MSYKMSWSKFLLLWIRVLCQLVQVLALCPNPFTMEAGLCVFVNADQSYTWCSANQQCALIGGELMNSHRSIELLLLGYISNANCNSNLWIGLSDLADERNSSRARWQRVNGKGIFPQDNSLFAGEPTGKSGENCMRKFPACSFIGDSNCRRLFGYICEYVSGVGSFSSTVWMATAFKGVNYNSDYCHTDIPMVHSRIEAVAAAMRAGNSRHVLYNSKLSTCRLLLFTDAQVEEEIETSPDWVKLSLHPNVI